MKQIIPQPKSRFVKLKCEKCKNEQVVFSKPSLKTYCLVCGLLMAEPTGGTGKITNAKTVEVFE